MDCSRMKEIVETGNLIRKNVHDLNNLLMVVEGNIRMMDCDDRELVSESLESLKECRQIIKSFFSAGCKLKDMGS
ncbi:hypothetical protein ACOBQJ_15460 [Pelotomaculum propionicicum]|uniref:hypothetical protein n=1 Tax=Pelotomaculum propionicicum TaxID=258475 RepID=UPI003B7F35A2